MKNILIVDDSKYIRTIVKNEILKVIEANIFLASSYKQASNFIKRNNLDIAVLDVHLPDADNGEVIDLALENNIPVIVLSSGVNATIKKIILQKDIVEYVTKSDPQAIAYVGTCVNRIIKNHHATVLIVDDSHVARATLKAYLDKLQIHTLEAGDYLEALSILHSNKKISLVLIDYMLTGLYNGMDLTMQIRQTYSKDKLAIIAISALDIPNIATNFLRHGANDFIKKPYTYEEFSVKVNSNLELIDLFADNRNKDQEIKEAYELFNSGNIIVFKWQNKENWPVSYVSKSLTTILGYKIEDFLSSKIKYMDIIHKDDLKLVSQEVEEYSTARVSSFTHKDYRLKRHNGSYAWVSDTTQIVYNQDNEITHYIGYIVDITEQREKDNELHEYIERFNLAIQSSRDGIWDWDIKNGSMFCSPALFNMLGYKEQETGSYKYLQNMIHPDDIDKAKKQLQKHLDRHTQYYETEYRVLTSSGKYKWILNRAKALFDQDGQPVRIIGFYTDIDSRKELELKFERLSVTDNLTGLFNRHSLEKNFELFLQTAIRFNRKMGLIFIDLDGFKEINDTFGHKTGDEVLIHVAHILQTTSRSNELSFRLGGDEFVVLIPEYTQEEELASLASRIIENSKKPITLNGNNINICMSIGITIINNNETLDEVLLRADAAMYHVKNNQKDGFAFEHKITK